MSDADPRRAAETAFKERFGTTATQLVRAPGRVNLIGEHTDYNDGFVLPMAIDHAVWIALRPAQGTAVRVHSHEFHAEGEFDLKQVRAAGPPSAGEGWLEYVKGTAWALMEAEHELRGWEGVIAGDVPIGAGLSSSAALEMATARAFAAVGDLPWDPAAMARLGQRAENAWVGVNCGIMDQMISASGRAGHAMLLDCRSLTPEHVCMPENASLVVLDTGTRRGLVDSAYNERRSQCEAVAEHLGVDALREVTATALIVAQSQLDGTALRRARHVVTENQRTIEAASVLAAGNTARMGELMDASHISLREDFEVSSDALNRMVSLARRQPGCFGARMTGAGFGGCAVALADADAAESLAQETCAAYRHETGNEPTAYVCVATDGAAVVTD
ncbi:MAG TPA: galactokinase [Candidatus Latescibacteria bacterium]|nr:galactokinase [Gemmatimonadota bacterium]HCV24550.1 galactokinase [Candidatus Latescibacterota bacterium]HJN30610.1 galactokinase [Candidatus Latescibacterota bacterium]